MSTDTVVLKQHYGLGGSGSGLVVLEPFVLYVPGKKCGKKCGRGSRVLWPATCNRINAAKQHVTNCIIVNVTESI